MEAEIAGGRCATAPTVWQPLLKRNDDDFDRIPSVGIPEFQGVLHPTGLLRLARCLSRLSQLQPLCGVDAVNTHPPPCVPTYAIALEPAQASVSSTRPVLKCVTIAGLTTTRSSSPWQPVERPRRPGSLASSYTWLSMSKGNCSTSSSPLATPMTVDQSLNSSNTSSVRCLVTGGTCDRNWHSSYGSNPGFNWSPSSNGT